MDSLACHHNSVWQEEAGGGGGGWYGDIGILETDSATTSIHLRELGVDVHHLIIRNTHSLFPSSWSPCTDAKLSKIHAICVVRHGRVSLHVL